MTIRQAEWHEILTVLRETHGIWSVGMNRSDHRRFLQFQLNHDWSRSHYRYMVYKRNGKIVSSCKLYEVGMTSAGKTFKVAGIGAVFTQPEARGTGCASQLLDDVIDMAAEDGYDAVLLYSEIGTEFYAQFGFEELGSSDIALLSRSADSVSKTAASSAPPPVVPRPLRESDLPALSRHHMRWLRYQPYGIARPLDYWRYKLSKEWFIRSHSTLAWPTIEVTFPLKGNGYMLLERSQTTLRLIEIVGNEEARMNLWRQAIDFASAEKLQRIRGWESLARDLAPGFSLTSLSSKLPQTDSADPLPFEPLRSYDRDWGIPMLLPLNDDLSLWSQTFPCPLLELDHF